jgi:hypothetical protein
MIWIVPLGLVVAVVLLVLAADAWLESAGGRQRLERELTDRLSMPVSLGGEFSLSLFPRPGVAGTGLQIGSGDGRGDFASSGSYLLALALTPLLSGEIEILSLHLSGGWIMLENWPARDPTGEHAREQTGSEGHKAAAPLPRIKRLELTDFDIRIKRGDAQPGIRITQLLLEDFAEGAQAPLILKFTIDPYEPTPVSVSSTMSLRLSEKGNKAAVRIIDLKVERGKVAIKGVTARLEWTRGGPLILDEFEWMESTVGRFAAAGKVLFDNPIHGELGLDYLAPDSTADGRAELQFVFGHDTVSLQDIKLEGAGQELSGEGCLLTAGEPSLQLTLHAGELDLDELRALITETLPGGSGSGDDAGMMDMDIVLTVGRARSSGVIANGVVIRVGESPECPTVTP